MRSPELENWRKAVLADPNHPHRTRWGYYPDSDSRRVQKDSRLLAVRDVQLSPSASLQTYEFAILNQGTLGSCGGHGTAQGLYTAFGAAGRPLKWCPSPLGIYTNARAYMRQPNPDGTLPKLTDSGVDAFTMMIAVNTTSIRPMRAPTVDGRLSDCDSTNVNLELAVADEEESMAGPPVGEFRIDETAPSFLTQVQIAIDQRKQPVGIGIAVDPNFESYDGGPPISTFNPYLILGGHWVVLTYYYLDASGKLVVGGPNSWSADYGKAGHFEMTGDVLTQCCTDAYPWMV